MVIVSGKSWKLVNDGVWDFANVAMIGEFTTTIYESINLNMEYGMNIILDKRDRDSALKLLIFKVLPRLLLFDFIFFSVNIVSVTVNRNFPVMKIHCYSSLFFFFPLWFFFFYNDNPINVIDLMF